MFRPGYRRRRVARLSAAAAPLLEPGETIHELVQVQTGAPAMANVGAVLGAESAAAQGLGTGPRPSATSSYALAATDRNVYALRLRGIRLRDVDSVFLKMPLDRLSARRVRDRIYLKPEGETERAFFAMVGFGSRADRLVAYVRSRNPVAPDAGA